MAIIAKRIQANEKIKYHIIFFAHHTHHSTTSANQRKFGIGNGLEVRSVIPKITFVIARQNNPKLLMPYWRYLGSDQHTIHIDLDVLTKQIMAIRCIATQINKTTFINK